MKTVFKEVADPTYLNWDAVGRKLYTITEDPHSNGRISSFSIDSEMNFIAGKTLEGPGKAGCHLEYYADINRLYAAAYGSGSLTGYLISGGEPEKNVCRSAYSGCGPNTARQEASHAHQVLRSVDKNRLYVCDLGSDTIWMHDLDAEGNAGEPVAALKVPAGYGPRHLAFDPSSPFVYILGELEPRLVTARITGDGSMKILADSATVKELEGNPANPAAIKIHLSGKTIAVSNRFRDTIGIFSIEYNDGEPAPVLKDEFTCRGKTPRDIEFSPDGRWLMIANQDSDNIEVRRFNTETGMPENEWAPGLKLGTPVCITRLEGLG